MKVIRFPDFARSTVLYDLEGKGENVSFNLSTLKDENLKYVMSGMLCTLFTLYSLRDGFYLH